MTPIEIAPLSTGRIVLFAFAFGSVEVRERPAIVVSSDGESADLQVFVTSKDAGVVNFDERVPVAERKAPSVERTGVSPAEDQGIAQANRWRWPPRV